QADAPIEEAIALMVRQKLTGRPVPKSGENLVGMWREWVEKRAGSDIDALLANIGDQQAFARTVRDMLSSMDMAENLGDEEDDREESEEDDEDKPQGDEQNDEGAEQDSGGEDTEAQ